MMSANSGVSMPETEVQTVINYSKPRLAPFGEMEVVVMESSSLRILGFLNFRMLGESLSPSCLNMNGHILQ